MQEDAQLTREEQRRIPSLASWVCDKLRQNDDWVRTVCRPHTPGVCRLTSELAESQELPFDDIVEELQDASIRGPVIDEIMVYLVEEQMAQYIQRSDGNFLQALG